jgi:hypothetical protein
VVKVSTNVKGARRRRSWYRRRLRRQRTLVAVVLGTVLVAACWQNAARYLSLPRFHSSQVLPASFEPQTNIHKDLALAAARSARPAKSHARMPGVYPYSVVPGGVKDPVELRAIAQRDYVVRRHYANFDYNHARLVRASEAREVYLSYRIRDTVFWTRKKIRLHVGELLLTDGKTTARARCGNQISEAAKPEVSNEEPAVDLLDMPVVSVESAPGSPMRAMLAPSDLPGGQPTAPQIFANSFFFPYIDVRVPLPSGGHCPAGEIEVNGHCIPKRHKPPAVPEPSTMILIASGLGLTTWRYRRTPRVVILP